MEMLAKHLEDGNKVSRVAMKTQISHLFEYNSVASGSPKNLFNEYAVFITK